MVLADSLFVRGLIVLGLFLICRVIALVSPSLLSYFNFFFSLLCSIFYLVVLFRSEVWHDST